MSEPFFMGDALDPVLNRPFETIRVIARDFVGWCHEHPRESERGTRGSP